MDLALLPVACRGTFGGRRKAVRDRLALQGGTGVELTGRVTLSGMPVPGLEQAHPSHPLLPVLPMVILVPAWTFY